MNLIWIKRSKDDWISIDVNNIRTFSSIVKYQKQDKEFKFRTLYINNEPVTTDHEQILYKALERYLTDPKDGLKNYNLNDAVDIYNKGQYPDRRSPIIR